MVCLFYSVTVRAKFKNKTKMKGCTQVSLPFYGIEQYNQNLEVTLIGQKTTSIREVPNVDGLPFFVQEVRQVPPTGFMEICNCFSGR